MATNNCKRPHRRLCVSFMKFKPSLKDSLCYSKSIYISFNLNNLTPLHPWPPLGGIHERKWGKAKKHLQLTKILYYYIITNNFAWIKFILVIFLIALITMKAGLAMPLTVDRAPGEAPLETSQTWMYMCRLFELC